MSKELASMMRQQVRVVGEKHSLCRKAMQLGRVLHVRMMLVGACRFSTALATLGIYVFCHGDVTVWERERSTVQSFSILHDVNSGIVKKGQAVSVTYLPN